MKPRAFIENLVPYSSARSEFNGNASVFLDANENSYGPPVNAGLTAGAHRYPDPLVKDLAKEIAVLRGVTEENIFVGNGSDEAIDLIVRAYVEPGQESILITPPTYGMYEVAAAINCVEVVRVPLEKETFALNSAGVIEKLKEAVKVVFLCSPNNPTGNLLEIEKIEDVLKNAKGIVVVDEAYIDFAKAGSALSLLNKYSNLIVLQTFSKAWGLAGARVGMAFASPEIIKVLRKIKPPYNVSTLAQKAAREALARREGVQSSVVGLVTERDRLISKLRQSKGIKKVYPSDANFILVSADSPRELYQSLLREGIVVRDRSSTPGLEGYIRITVGTPEENELLLQNIAKFYGSDYKATTLGRKALVQRATSETEILVSVNLDTPGLPRIGTGIGFFDHMLHQIARHGKFELVVQARGDLEVDEHHTIEDVGLALGEAMKKALGNKLGIGRYGFVLPMDEACAQVSLDLSGRALLKFDAKFSREKVGELPTEMVEHFFKSLSDTLGAALHIQAAGENDHHIVESIFKGVGKVFEQAFKVVGSSLPSTKGVL